MTDKNKRYRELYDLINSANESAAKALKPTIEMIADLETRLENLRDLPFILINPKNKNQMKATAAGKQYKELSQIYDNKMKIILKAIRNDAGAESDGLEEFLENWRAGR